MTTILWEMEMKLWPKSVESPLISDNLHPECCLFSDVKVQLLGEDLFIGKVEVLWACYDVLAVLYLLSDLNCFIIWWCKVVVYSGLWNGNILVLLFLNKLFFRLIIEKELIWFGRQFDSLFFFSLLFLFNLDLLSWFLLRSPSPLRSPLDISISDLHILLCGTIKAFNLIFNFLNSIILDIILKDLYLATLLYRCKSTSTNKYFICCFLSRLALGSSFIFLSAYFFWETGLILLGDDGAT